MSEQPTDTLDQGSLHQMPPAMQAFLDELTAEVSKAFTRHNLSSIETAAAMGILAGAVAAASPRELRDLIVDTIKLNVDRTAKGGRE